MSDLSGKGFQKMNEQMSELQVFANPQFGQIRAVEVDGEPWFVGKDVAEALGYSNPRDALAKHVDGEDKGVSQIATPSGIQEMTILNESGLYSLIFSSKLPSARVFKRWVTSEVLPSIRRTGGYTIPAAPPTAAPPPTQMRDLTADDYITAAQLTADCLDERLPYVLGFLRLGGFSIPKVARLSPQTKAEPKASTVVDLDAFVHELIEGRNLTERGYLFSTDEFNRFCLERNLSPRIVRRRLYAEGYIEGKREANGKLAYSVTFHIDGAAQRRVVVRPQR